MNVSSLTLAELKKQLQKTGIFIRTGCFVTHIQTSIPSIAKGLHLLYGDYPLESKFADFHVSLDAPRNIRRWLKPQILFLFDGISTFKPLPRNQAFPMLEWGLNWCVSSHANSYLIIHAAVVERGGYCAILPAPPGSGKSTLCAALVNRGWRLLSDELTLVRIKDGKVIPLPRPVSLKNASIHLIKEFAPEAIVSDKVEDTMKGTVAHMKAPRDSVYRAHEVALPAWIIFPKYQPGATACLKTITRSRAFMRVADNAFNYSLLGSQGFAALGEMIGKCDCYEFTYSDLNDAIETFFAIKPANSA